MFTLPINAINYTVQTGYFKFSQNANSMTNELLDRGFNVYKHKSGNRYYVFVGEFDNWNAANKILKEVKKVISNAFIKKIDIELNKKDDKAIENDLEKKSAEKSNYPREETKNQEKIKPNEEASKNIDFSYYINQENYIFKNGYLLDINGDKLKLYFPNGVNKIFDFFNKYKREIKRNKEYLLVFKKNELIDLLPKRSEEKFSKSLQDLGYINDIDLNPINNKFYFRIPLSKNIEKKDISLELYIKKANFVESNTYLDIIVNDSHLKTIKLNDLNQVYKYKIDLKNGIKFTDSLNIVIKSRFSVNNPKNNLNKYNEKSWVKLGSNSKINFSLKDKLTYNINNFLNMEAKEIKLLYDQNLTLNLMEKYIKISTMLNRKFENQVTNNYLPDDKKATDISNINNQVRKILISEKFKTTELLDNLTLKLAPKDVDFFLSKYNYIINSNKLMLNSFNVVNNKNMILNSYSKNIDNNSKNGWGNVVYDYYIPANIFKRYPKEIKLHLTGSYFIPFNNQAYLKVYLNDKLINVEKLNSSKYFEDKIISIPGKEIESLNNLKIVFSQTPDENLNIFSNIMETYINPESFLTYSGDIFRNNNFSNLLLNFKGKGKILITRKYKEELFNTANLFMSQINKYDNLELDFTIDFLENYNIDSEKSNIKWYLVIGADKVNENIKSRVNMVGNNIKITGAENKENVSIDYVKTLSYIDLNTIDNKKVIFLNSNSNYDNLSKMILEINKKSHIYELEGNLLIYNGENYKTFNISNSTTISKTDKYLLKFKKVFFDYKLQIYILSVVLIILFLIWVYYKTARNRKKKD